MNNFLRPTRREALGMAAALAAGAAWAQGTAAHTVRIGYQKSSTLTIWLKSRGTLERALSPLGVAIGWHEFSSGLPLLEALNIGAIDLSADVADAVPPFALAAGARLSYYAVETPSPQAQAIVVKGASPLTQLAQLKGARIAFAKGAGAHYLVLEALHRVGLSIRDISPAYLTPADGRAAFENGSAAAWAIWDPFLAAVQRQAGARVLPESVGISAYRRFYLASTAYLQSRPDVVAAVYGRLREAGEWVKANPRPAAEWHAPVIGLDVDTVQAANARRSYRVEAVDHASLVEQQRIADTFAAEGVLPRRVDIAAVPVWRPPAS